MAKKLKPNVLYYGDNLEVLRDYIPDETVDLIYLDPPFNSNRNYNVLFKEQGAKGESPAQIQAFEDTWHPGESANRAFEEVALRGSDDTAKLLKAMVDALGHNDVTAYLSMMAVRLIELHRVLKPTGSIYLHCDPTASHYLKVLMDSIFGPAGFLGEIIWRRTASHVTQRRWPRLHDTILHFAKDAGAATFTPPRTAANSEWIEREYRYEDERGRYMVDNLTGAGTTNGPSGQPWRGVDPAAIGAGRHWRYVPETLDKLDADGRIYWPPKGKYPKLKQYLSESGGAAIGDLWTDISVIGRTAGERLGYPTQKPLALLERVIEASSNPGDVVLDPFCGCGTAVHAAQKLNRNWVGIDITNLAINLIRRRMEDAFPELKDKIEVVGEPVDLPGAEQLAEKDKYQFQWWALDRIGAAPAGGDKKKGMDRGIDGVIPFMEGVADRQRVIVSVKGGNITSAMVRDLVGVLKREEAAIGVFLTLRPPTKEMKTEAAAAGMYVSTLYGKSYSRVQILTVADILNGKRVDMPPSTVSPFAKAATEEEKGKQAALEL